MVEEVLELSPGNGRRVEPRVGFLVRDVLDPGVLWGPRETADRISNVFATWALLPHELEVETAVVEENAEAG
jgi:hypothetical protein